MFESIMRFFKKLSKKEEKASNSKDAAKERLHLVLMQDRANVSADFLELMKQEIIEVIKKYIDIDEKAIDVRLTNKENEDGTNGAPALYANIPIINIKNDARKIDVGETKNKVIRDKETKTDNKIEDKKKEEQNIKQKSQEEKQKLKEEEQEQKEEEQERKEENEEKTEEQKEKEKIEKIKEKEEIKENNQKEEKEEIKENDLKEDNKNNSKEEIKSKN